MTSPEAMLIEPTENMAPWLTLLDLAPVRIWLLDAGHRVRWANRAWS